MQADPIIGDNADDLIQRHGAAAIGVLVDRIADAVRLSDDQAVGMLDHLLQLVELRIEGTWRAGGPIRNG